MLNDFWQVIRHPLRWLRCKPPAGAAFRVSLREAVQGLCGVTCEFKPITEAGEELCELRAEASRRATSKPSKSGNITSSTISCGRRAATAATASAPVAADSTSKPSNRSAIEMTSTMFGSSSTTSMRRRSSFVLMQAFWTPLL